MKRESETKRESEKTEPKREVKREAAMTPIRRAAYEKAEETKDAMPRTKVASAKTKRMAGGY